MRAGFAQQGNWFITVAGLMLLSGVAQANAALDWLVRASAAARQQNYSGVYIYHHGEHVEVLRVLHLASPSGELHKIEVVDGAPRQFLRVNNDVYCYLPDGKNVRLERNTQRRFFPALLPVEPASLLKHYDAKLGWVERVAGRSSQVVTLEPRDDYRYAYNLWLDQQTGLPLKSRILNGSGSVVSMFVFSEVQIGKAPDARLFRNDLAGKRIQKTDHAKADTLAWKVTPPPGFAQIRAVVRSLPGKQAPVSHLVFSDGMSVLSMFVEPSDPGAQRLQGLSAEGAIGVYAREVDGYTVTTLGEVPSLALIETGNSVNRK